MENLDNSSAVETCDHLTDDRKAGIWKLPLDYIDSDDFRNTSLHDEIMAEMPPNSKKQSDTRAPAGAAPYRAALYDCPLLTPKQAKHLFRKYNFLKYRASALRSNSENKKHLPDESMDEIVQLFNKAIEVRNVLVQSNLRLVVSIVNNMRGQLTIDPDEAISEGNYTLIGAVDKFDYGRGFSFTTYATKAIIRRLLRINAQEGKRGSHFQTGSHYLRLDGAIDDRPLPSELERRRQSVQEAILIGMKTLNPSEKKIITQGYGINDSTRVSFTDLANTAGQTKQTVGNKAKIARKKILAALRKSGISHLGDL